MKNIVYTRMLGLLLVSVMLSACGGEAATPATGGPLKRITVGMGYIPNVQFAAYYVAQAKGYYREAGLDVTLEYGSADDLLAQVAVGKLDFANSEGDELIVAASKGVKDVYVLTQYQKFPVALFYKAETPIKSVADLKGKKIGLPGKFGANYNGLKAMLYANNMTEADVTLIEIGYTQAQAVQTGAVEAAMGYAMNEPVTLAQRGVKLGVLQVSEQYDLASVGIITSQDKVANDPATVQAFVSATLRGMAEMNRDPNGAFEIAAGKDYANLDQPSRAVQQAVLNETVKFQQPPAGRKLGSTEPALWQSTAKFLRDSKLITGEVDVNTLFTNRFVEAANLGE